MKKLIITIAFSVLLPSVAHALTAQEALIALKSISFPLYGKDASAGRQCVGWNAYPNQSGQVAYYLSAGHCENAYLSIGERGLSDSPLLAKVNDVGRFEFLYSQKPVCNTSSERYLPLSDVVDSTKKFFTLAQTSGTEAWEKIGVVELKYLRDDPKRGLVFAMVCPTGRCKQLPSAGLSGSPIIDDDLNVVGIMKGAWAVEPDHPLGTALSPILPFLKSVASTNAHINRARYCAAPTHQLSE